MMPYRKYTPDVIDIVQQTAGALCVTEPHSTFFFTGKTLCLSYFSSIFCLFCFFGLFIYASKIASTFSSCVQRTQFTRARISFHNHNCFFRWLFCASKYAARFLSLVDYPKLILHYYKWLIFDLFAFNLNEQRNLNEHFSMRGACIESTASRLLNVNREMDPEQTEICYSFLSSQLNTERLKCVVQSTTSTVAERFKMHHSHDKHEFANQTAMQSIQCEEKKNILKKERKEKKGAKE